MENTPTLKLLDIKQVGIYIYIYNMFFLWTLSSVPLNSCPIRLLKRRQQPWQLHRQPKTRQQ